MILRGDVMSGGSFDYGYCVIERDYVGRMEDREMNDLMNDIAKVMHDLEWWQSCDISEEDYRETVDKFKEKWFKQSSDDRLKKYIDAELDLFKKDIHRILRGKKL